MKFVFPLEYPIDLVGRFLRKTSEREEHAVEDVDQSPVEVVPGDFARLPDRVPPPRHWVDKHGPTRGCISCEKRKGQHSKACYERYSEWLRGKREHPAIEEEKPGEERNEPNLSADTAGEVVKIPGLPSGMQPTRRCPACESRMNAPGCRHNAECERAQQDFLNPEKASAEVPDHPMDFGGHGFSDSGYSPSLPPSPRGGESRPMDVEMQDVEEEQLQEDVPMLDVVCACNFVRFDQLSSAEFLMKERFDVSSISFEGSQHESIVVDLCGVKVKLWKPTSAVSDTTLEPLDPEGTFLAMVKEVKGLTMVEAGNVLTGPQSVAFCQKYKVKIIACRWVTNAKPEAVEGVRARIVVKDFAKGELTARAQGISSPTPSVESLRMLLGAVSGAWTVSKGMNLYSADISQAFMHSPLEAKVCVRLPLSVSTLDGQPVFLEARKGLNGLRISSLAWIQVFDQIVRSVGVKSHSTEPCLYSGLIGQDPAIVIACLTPWQSM